MCMRKKELIAQLAERDARIERLEQRVQSMNEAVEGYHSRESAVVDALARAQEAAENIVAQAKSRAATLLREAQSQADRILFDARSESATLLSQAEATVSEYEETIAAYNAALSEAAAEAAAKAEHFAAFTRSGRIRPSGLAQEVAGLHEVPFAPPVELEAPSDSPAQLMQNIYRIQKRTLPEQDAPAEEAEEPRALFAQVNAGVQEEETAPLADAAGEEPLATVQGVLKENENAPADASLDDLLDEIIKAGEQYNG